MPPEADRQIGAVILAAGAAQRMGSPKQLLEIEGRSLLQRTIEATLQVPALWPVVVVVGAHRERVRPAASRHPVLLADNPAWAEGMASSLRVGLSTLHQFSRHLDAALFLLCDQPALTPAMIESLLQAWNSSPEGVVTARYNDHLGAPALVGRSHFPMLSQLTGDEGARQLFHRLPPSALRSVDLPALAWDVDTPADFDRWRT